jgi:hypothetical protein
MARNGHAEDLSNVRYWENSGRHVLALSFSGFDPEADLAVALPDIPSRSQ